MPDVSATLKTVLTGIDKQITAEAWGADYAIRGEKTAQARRYVDGDQDAKLTKEKLEQLNLPISVKSAFTTNYCDTVLSTMVDRIDLSTIQADNPEATMWVQDLLEANDIDEFAVDVHEAAIRDADTFVMVSYDPESKQVVFSHEPAWDGVSGMLVYYSHAGGRRTLSAAVKVWSEMELLRVNVYTANSVTKYSNAGGKGLVQIAKEPWVTRQGEPLGVPVVHFANRKSSNDDYGLSELDSVIPLQDALNRTVHSMVMAGEYTAFKLRYVIGLPAPTSISPGKMIEWSNKGLNGEVRLGIDEGKKVEVGEFDAANLSGFIEQCDWFVKQIGFVSRTPNREMMGGDNASGEALKQREASLLGKVKRFETKATTAWKRVVTLAHSIQMTFGEQPPDYNRWIVQWGTAEVRDDNAQLQKITTIKDDLPRIERLRLAAPVFGWDETKVLELNDMVEKEKEKAAQLAIAALPTFENSAI